MAMVSIDEFKKLEIKIGKVLSAQKVVGADKLVKLIFDIGGEERQIIAGRFQAQCYCWLTGFEDWQVHIYNAVSGKIEARIKGKLNLQEFKKMLDLAIDLQSLEFAKTNCLGLSSKPIECV